MRRFPRVLLLVVLALVASCHIEKRVPAGPMQDEETIRAVILRYYRGALTQDSTAVANAVADSVNAEIEADGHWQQVRGAGPWAHIAAGAGPVHISEPSRIDIRQEDDLASAWVQARNTTGSEMTHLLLRRQAGTWEIISVATAPSTAGR